MPRVKKTTVTDIVKAVNSSNNNDDNISIDNISTDNTSVDNTSVYTSAKSTTEVYKKLSHIEHILLRPSTYIGSIEKVVDLMHVLDQATKKIVKRNIEFVPGLYKIFDEILVNAIDQYVRLLEEHITNDTVFPVSTIKIDINKESGEISVYNDGEGLQIYVTTDGIYTPELVFGHLLSGSNFDDKKDKIVGGQNGYGSKLTNIFSTTFTVETVDKTRSLKYIQTFSKNMLEKTNPKISTYSSKPYTKITFKPEYARFGLTGLTDDMYDLMCKRVYDVAAWTDKSVNVCLNGEKLDYKCFEKYVDLYIGNKIDYPRVYLHLNDRWDLIVTYNENSLFEQVSFVNGIHTKLGGKHVDYIVSQITTEMAKYIEKKRKITVLKSQTIKNELLIFLKATIVNPHFDSQTKENLTTPASKFGSTAVIDNKMIDKIAKTGIMDRILNVYENKNAKDLQKTDGKKKRTVDVPKLKDAGDAGTKNSKECILILTEGDSAKTSVVSGLTAEMTRIYGVFPLRGKFINVCGTKDDKLSENAEYTAIKKILGLQSGINYKELLEQSTDQNWPLRYGKVMLLTDQDTDGSHIKALVMNLFNNQWRYLMEIGLIVSMLTPIVKVSKGKGTSKQTISFYNLGDYQNWQSETPNHHTWSVHYYKGLGTSDVVEFREYFKDIKLVNYIHNGDSSNEVLDMAFNKKRAEDRKKWLEDYDINTTLDYNNPNVTVEDFVNKDLIHFSNYDNRRSIPNVCDGLKPGQRKILFSAFKRNLRSLIKVAQLAGYVSEHSAYHHGETSLQGTIIAMAQNFVGSNNLALFVPSGQFGSRIQNGGDAASARYIFTQLADITKKIFPDDDLPLFTSQEDDGMKIEPLWYAGIIPMILVNGTRGIGSGYSTFVPNHNPIDIINAYRLLLKGEELKVIRPWYYGFNGSVILQQDGKYATKGVYEILDEETILIKEIPINYSFDDYSEYLKSIKIAPGNKNQYIKSFDDSANTFDSVHIIVKVNKETLFDWESEPGKIEEILKLVDTSNTSYSNMWLYDRNIKLRKYANIYEIIHDFYDIRYQLYVRRKEYMLEQYKHDLEILSEKYRFIKMNVDNEIDLRGIKHSVVEELLINKEFKKVNDTFDHLVKMPIQYLTYEKLLELQNNRDKKQVEYDLLLNKTVENIWLDELDALEVEVNNYYKALDEIRSEPPIKVSGKKGTRANNSTKKAKK